MEKNNLYCDLQTWLFLYKGLIMPLGSHKAVKGLIRLLRASSGPSKALECLIRPSRAL